MTTSKNKLLPPLRKRIRSSILLMNSLYVLVGCLLMLSVYWASSVSPTILRQNYNSLAAINEMNVALLKFQLLQLADPVEAQHATQEFETALKFAQTNVSIFGESELLHQIEQHWQLIEKENAITKPQVDYFKNQLTQLTRMNEDTMFDLARENEHFGQTILGISLALLCLIAISSIFFVDWLSHKIASPIKALAERLKNNPNLTDKLLLPCADSAEMQILTEEMERLWSRLSQFASLNVGELDIQSKKLEAILQTVEDAIMVVDANNTIIHCNKGMLNILHLQGAKVQGIVWTDLPTGSFNFMRLRNFLRSCPDNNAEIEFVFGTTKRLFAFRRKEIIEKPHHVVGTVYLFHDITGGLFKVDSTLLTA